jgi:tripartite-type tricarboxylate transporter receptor subunit TctC
MYKNIVGVLFLVLLTVSLTIFVIPQATAGYPDKPLTIVEPWPAGSAGDSGARILAQLAQKKFGQPIVVQNVVGGGGAKAALFVKNAKPDGYTILNSWVANLVMRPIFDSKVG